MIALTIQQPWAWAIANAGKDIENRTWPPPRKFIGSTIAIHAGKTFDRDSANAVRAIREAILRDSDKYSITERFALIHVAGQVPDSPSECAMGAIVAIATIVGVSYRSSSPWFAGPYGWLLDNIKRLDEPVPCRGAHGIWTVPEPVAEQVLEQVR